MDMFQEALQHGYNPTFYKDVQVRRRREEEDRRQAEAIAEMSDIGKRMATMKRRLATLAEIKQKAADRLRQIEDEEETVTAKELIRLVAMSHGVSYADIIRDCRTKAVVEARHEAMAVVARLKPHFSLPKLGEVFSRDHTTIMYALKKLGITR